MAATNRTDALADRITALLRSHGVTQRPCTQMPIVP